MDFGSVLSILASVTAVVTPVITYCLSSRKHGLQAVFRYDKERTETELTLRNTSNGVIFIDRIELHQSYWIDFDLTSQFGNNCFFLGQYTTIVFDSDSLKGYISEALEKGKMSKFYRKYGSRRMGFRLIVESSEGLIATTWFKIGERDEVWRVYDFASCGKSYYSFRSFYNPREPYGAIVAMLAFVFGLALYDAYEVLGIVTILCGYALSLVQILITSAGGFSNGQTATMLGLIAGLPLILTIWLINPNTSQIPLCFMIYLISTMYHCGWTRKMSGWNL